MILRRRTTQSIQDKLDFLLLSQYWSVEKLREYQKKKLQKLIKHCYDNVPYYQVLFDQIDIDTKKNVSTNEFYKIPILTKKQIQENFAELLSKDVLKEQLILNSTGGSTGQPLNFYQDKQYANWRQSATIRAWKYFVGFQKDELEALIWGAEKDIGKGLGIKKVLYHVTREGILPLNTFDLDRKLIEKFLFYYNILKPKIFRGYASSLYFIATFVEENNLRIKSPNAIISSAEMLWPEMRKKIENVFNAKIFDSYGCREVSQIATECQMHNGLHIVMENQYVELIENQVIVTNLNNYCMPLIRYKIGDIAEKITDSICECGRGSSRLIGLKGRESEMIVLPNGKIIHGEYFTHLFYGLFSTSDFSVEYNNRHGSLTIKCNNISEDDKKSITNLIKKDFNLTDIKFERLISVNKTSSGKYRFIKIVNN